MPLWKRELHRFDRSRHGRGRFFRVSPTHPWCFFRLGTCNEKKQTCAPQHNNRFDVDDDALKIGMKVLTASALEFLNKK